MRRKWIVLSAVLLSCATLSYFLFPKFFRKKHTPLSQLCIKGAYFEPVEIREFFSHIPCVDMNIGDRTVRVKVDLGFCGDISLPGKLLQELDDKLFFRRMSHFGIRGKMYYSDVYKIPKINIGNMALFQTKAQETNPGFEKDAIFLQETGKLPRDYLGRIGWELFHNFNFFLDCENSLIAFCDSLDTLRERGYPVDSFIEIPLLLDRNIIEFEAVTETGPIRCMLDTGATWNMLNKDMEERSNKHIVLNPDTIDQHLALNPENDDQMTIDPEDVYEMPVFKIGKKEFGPMKFNRIKTPLEIDAIVGMEFLHYTLVFIDFPNRKIYFYEK